MPRSKKEIDKELMYKKIMPTANFIDGDSDFSDRPVIIPPVAPAAPSGPVPDVVAQPIVAPPPPITEPQLAPVVLPEEPPEDDPVNIMESLIESRIDAAIDKFRCCTCDKCRKAITAYALNKLPPFYVPTHNNKKMQEAEGKYAGQVATALVQAILNVKSHPAH